jgi:hypothetical protein
MAKHNTPCALPLTVHYPEEVAVSPSESPATEGRGGASPANTQREASTTDANADGLRELNDLLLSGATAEAYGRAVAAALPKLLFNPPSDVSDQSKSNASAELLSQYELYVEMADRISQRRDAANRYLMTLCSGLVAIAAFLLGKERTPLLAGTEWPAIWLLSFCGCVLCVLWWRLIRSYKDLNSGKFAVIHALESRLPARVYAAEWAALGFGRRIELYLPFTEIEGRVPWVFFCLFAAGLLFAPARLATEWYPNHALLQASVVAATSVLPLLALTLVVASGKGPGRK